MNIREKYNIKENSNSFSFQPLKPLQKLSSWFLAGIFATAILLPLFREMLDETLFFALYILLAYGVIHSLYDILIRAKISYTFDLRANSVYRMSPVSEKKKIMKLEEAVIFVSSEMGSWHYSLGAKKSHFVKSYAISENFSSGKKSDAKQEIYEEQILMRINKMIDSAQGLTN
ncbi:hypothetical protein [Flavobacterium chungangense]|uniref:Uncharacterized protein n=1 Tax=Flavobacterium chungangense TaxID=554283 RepID=A0A6V6Z0E9_9FLAO|nr:hypothetical protein [Flavobacterium chungangense]CAD0005230.1 hypothetical protein FLACHUCJ7_02282 [Flavobacterium chungangense]